MDQRLKNRLERISNLSLYLQQQQANWDTVPAVKARITYFLAEQAKLPTPTPDADPDNFTTGTRKGAKNAKDAARTELIDHLVPVAASLYLWLTDPANQPTDPMVAEAQRAKAAQLDIRRPSALRNMATLSLIGLAQLTLDALDLVPAADLEAFDLTTSDTAAFEKAAGLFGLRRNLPRATAQQLAAANTSLDDQLSVLELFVEGDLRKAVDTRRTKDPAFVRGFKQAYQTIDRRATRTASPTPTPTAPPPSNP